jgi:hypothetical protein
MRRPACPRLGGQRRDAAAAGVRAARPARQLAGRAEAQETRVSADDMDRWAHWRLILVCDPRKPDWKTSRADARAALNLAKGVHPDDIDAQGYAHTPDGYACVRRSWARHVEIFGWNEGFRPDHMAGAYGYWLAARPDLAAGDEWLPDGRKLHLARYPDGQCGSDSCTLHPCPGAGERWASCNGDPACPACRLSPAALGVPRPRRRPRPAMPPVQDSRGPWCGTVPEHPRRAS